MSPTPLIIAKGSKALGAAVGGAAKGATKIAMSEKTAKLTDHAFTALKEAGDSGAMQSFESMFNDIKNSGPIAGAFDVLFERFSAGTMSAKVEAMDSLLKSFDSEAGSRAIDRWNGFMSDMITTGSDLVQIAVQLSDADLQGSLITFGQILEKWAWLFGKDPSRAPTLPPSFSGGGSPDPFVTQRPGMQEFD